MTRDLVKDLFCRYLGDVGPESMDDGAVLPSAGGKLVFTTDSYVVSPLEFPGGNIGTLAVCGTVNDLAVMGARPLSLSLGVILEAGLEFEALERIVKSDLKSDCAPLNGMLSELLSNVSVKWMRDATRGGVATVLNELTEGRNWGVLLEERKIPVSEVVSGGAELLGLDPLYSANEGKTVLVVPADEAEKALKCLKNTDYGHDARVVGSVIGEYPGELVLDT